MLTFLDRWFISTNTSRSKQPMWRQGLNLPATFILDPLIYSKSVKEKRKISAKVHIPPNVNQIVLKAFNMRGVLYAVYKKSIN